MVQLFTVERTSEGEYQGEVWLWPDQIRGIHGVGPRDATTPRPMNSAVFYERGGRVEVLKCVFMPEQLAKEVNDAAS